MTEVHPVIQFSDNRQPYLFILFTQGVCDAIFVIPINLRFSVIPDF